MTDSVRCAVDSPNRFSCEVRIDSEPEGGEQPGIRAEAAATGATTSVTASGVIAGVDLRVSNLGSCAARTVDQRQGVAGVRLQRAVRGIGWRRGGQEPQSWRRSRC